MPGENAAHEKVIARMNVRDVHIAFLIKDSINGAEWEPPEKIPGVMQIQVSPQVASASLFGDGRRRHHVSIVTGYDVTLDHNMIPPKIMARMRGQTYDDATGVRRSNTRDQAAACAVGWTVDLIGEYEEVTWLPKCVIAPSDRNIQQTTESIEYSTDSLTVTSLSLEYNGDFEYQADTTGTSSNFTKEVAAKFFDKVFVLPPKGPVVPPELEGIESAQAVKTK